MCYVYKMVSTKSSRRGSSRRSGSRKASAGVVRLTSAMLKALNSKRRKAKKTSLKRYDRNQVRMSNGALAGYRKVVSKSGKVGYKFVITHPVSSNKAIRKSYMKKISSRRGKVALSRKSALRAFSRYYRNRDYKTEADRKRAMSRDLHYRPRNSKKIVTNKSTRYLRNPGKLDYPGVDDGRKKMPSRRSDKVFMKRASLLGKSRKGVKVIGRSSKKSLRYIKRGGSNNNKSNNNNNNNNIVSLRTAVGLLRQYYANRFNNQQQQS